MVINSGFVIIHESRISRMYFETQMAGEFSMSQILLKLGVKWPLVKAFQLHYFPAQSEVVRFSSFEIILSLESVESTLKLNWLENSQCLRSCSNLVWSGLWSRPFNCTISQLDLRWSDFQVLKSFMSLESVESTLKLKRLENSQCLRSCSNLVWSGLW